VKIAGILLAAGRSTRFGSNDKLAALLGGRPILDRAAEAMRAVQLQGRFVVRAGPTGGLGGFDRVSIPPNAPMSRSLAEGVGAARRAGADAVLVALGDMPFVTEAHLARLIANAEGRSALLASYGEGRRSPPALFGADWFDELEGTTGDAGARALIARAELVEAPPGTLRDIDTVADLAAVEAASSLG
jgi:molybdenum cofactor cytidylyltransferase